jgi:hypothetical protein
MKDAISRTHVETFFSLVPGLHVEVDVEEGTRWRGAVETTAPDLGVLWIRTETGERKLVNIQEHTISLLHSTLKAAAT